MWSCRGIGFGNRSPYWGSPPGRPSEAFRTIARPCQDLSLHVCSSADVMNAGESAFIWSAPPQPPWRTNKASLCPLQREEQIFVILWILGLGRTAVLNSSLWRAEGVLLGSFDWNSQHKQVGQATVIAFILPAAAAAAAAENIQAWPQDCFF